MLILGLSVIPLRLLWHSHNGGGAYSKAKPATSPGDKAR